MVIYPGGFVAAVPDPTAPTNTFVGAVPDPAAHKNIFYFIKLLILYFYIIKTQSNIKTIVYMHKYNILYIIFCIILYMHKYI